MKDLRLAWSLLFVFLILLLVLAFAAYVAAYGLRGTGEEQIGSVYVNLELGMPEDEVLTLINHKSEGHLQSERDETSGAILVCLKARAAHAFSHDLCLRIGMKKGVVESYAVYSAESGRKLSILPPVGPAPARLGKRRRE